MSTQFALANGFEKGAHFLFFARREELDPPVRQVAHGTGDIKALRDLSD